MILGRPVSRRGVFGLLAGVSIVAGLAVLSQDVSGAEVISPADARVLLDEGTLLIDIRRPDEWVLTGVATGATLIDMRVADFAERVLAAAGGDKTRPIVLICARGVRSRRMSEQLKTAGYSAVSDVGEGMLGSFSGPGYLARGLLMTPYKSP